MAYNTIKIKKHSDVVEEYVASATITPGMLLELGSDGKVKPHSQAGKTCEKMFALEDELQGKGIDDDYKIGDKVQCWIPGRGDVVYAIQDTSEIVTIGEFLESAGDGTLQAVIPESDSGATYPDSVVGVAIEAVTTTSDETRILIRII